MTINGIAFTLILIIVKTGYVVVGDEFKCKPRPGCNFVRCDPIRVISTNALNNREYPITCEGNPSGQQKEQVSRHEYEQLRNDLRRAQAELQNRKFEPKLYRHVSTLTWQTSKEFCGRFGRSLCSRDQICPQKNGGRELRRDVIPGDHWVAVTDAFNEWVQIGHYPVTPCTMHIAIWGPPLWGTSNISISHKGFVYCCHSEPKEYPRNDQSDVRYQYIGNAATYESSLAHCEEQERRLCNLTEVCKWNEPVFGLITGNMWIAIGDKFNEWVQIGNYQGRTCKTHGKLPTWGVRKDGSQRGDVGYVYCCKRSADE